MTEKCSTCRGFGKVYPEHLQGGIVALDDIPGYNPRVKCPNCNGTGSVTDKEET